MCRGAGKRDACPSRGRRPRRRGPARARSGWRRAARRRPGAGAAEALSPRLSPPSFDPNGRETLWRAFRVARMPSLRGHDQRRDGSVWLLSQAPPQPAAAGIARASPQPEALLAGGLLAGSAQAGGAARGSSGGGAGGPGCTSALGASALGASAIGASALGAEQEGQSEQEEGRPERKRARRGSGRGRPVECRLAGSHDRHMTGPWRSFGSQGKAGPYSCNPCGENPCRSCRLKGRWRSGRQARRRRPLG